LLFEEPTIDIESATSTAAKISIKVTTTTNDFATAYEGLKDVFFFLIETTANETDPFSEDKKDLYPYRRFQLTNFNAELDKTKDTNYIKFTIPDGSLKPNTYYAVKAVLRDTDELFAKKPWELFTVAEVKVGPISVFSTLQTGAPGDVSYGSTGSISVESTNTGVVGYDLACNPLGAVGTALLGGADLIFSSGRRANLAGCIAELSYTLWEISGSLAQLNGKILDFMVYYSLDGTSYSSEFIDVAWGTVRDIANIFFIIALLYIAIKTILNVGASNSKRLIGAIVIAALLINFSSFITKVVIDSSNILAKVFYNQIQPNPGDNNQVNLGGQTSVTEKLVTNLNPQKIVSEDIYKSTHGQGTFIFVTLLALAITLYMAWIFASVAFLFISRVIVLWLCLIFAPIAFVSYSFSFRIPGVGHDDWWDMLLKNAFLAPLFVFFLYITVLFTEYFPQTFLIAQTGTTNDMMQALMQTIIPVLLCFILLKKGKEIAVKYSGEMGSAVNKFAGIATGTIGVKYVGGFLASKFGQAGRATVGRAGAAMAKSTKLQKSGFGRFIAGIGEKASKASFDIRGAGGYQKALGAIGASKYVGKAAGVGGWEKASAERTRKRMAAAEKMRPKASDPEMKKLIDSEKNLQSVLMKATATIEKLDKQMAGAREGATDASNLRKFLASQGKHAGDADYDKAVEDENMFRSQLAAFKEHKNGIKKGIDLSGSTTTYVTRDASGAPVSRNVAMDVDMDYSTELKVGGHSIDDLEKEVAKNKRDVSIKHAQNLAELADSYDTELNKFLYGNIEVTEDSHKIRMGQKLDSGSKH
ncbi:MAG TPA: hypothetical protein PLO44_01640, partial [Candidatus Paceibacterota bacterium]|nr:hypothetical protein [Candidatus Paceibacterota bacterium]